MALAPICRWRFTSFVGDGEDDRKTLPRVRQEQLSVATAIEALSAWRAVGLSRDAV